MRVGVEEDDDDDDEAAVVVDDVADDEAGMGFNGPDAICGTAGAAAGDAEPPGESIAPDKRRWLISCITIPGAAYIDPRFAGLEPSMTN